MNAQFKAIGESFVAQYYKMFDQNRESVINFYGADSMLSFEGKEVQGPAAIMERLKTLPFKTVIHVITTKDFQPTKTGGVLIHVVGQLRTDQDQPHSFSQTFNLSPNVPGNQDSGLYVFNDIFRLTLHNG